MCDFRATFFSCVSLRHANRVGLKKGWTGTDKPYYSEKQKEAFRRMLKSKVNHRFITKTDGDGNKVRIKVSKSEMKQFK